jgi:hypothetical protein
VDISILPSMSMITTPDGHQVLGQSYTNWLGEIKVRLAIPLSLRQEAAGHWSAKATISRARNYFLYPGIVHDITARYLHCLGCLQKQKSPTFKETSHQPDHSAGPLQKVYLDLYGPLPGVPRYNSLQILPGRREGPTKQVEMKYILSVEV